MRRIILTIAAFAVPFAASAQAAPISRQDGYVMMWNTLRRPIAEVRTTFSDMNQDTEAGKIIAFGRYRKILADNETFRPNDPLNLSTALTWLFRTRNIADPDEITPETLSGFVMRYPIARLPDAEYDPTLSEAEVSSLIQMLDIKLMEEDHEVSLYSEKFHGKGTAFGESFDMNSLTAAHRTFPHNTLVKVTNIRNGKSVTVRINDRGPYVEDRDMDLSLAAFTSIEDRSKGILRATFQRLGDVNLVGPCKQEPMLQKRITRDTLLNPGIPQIMHLGGSLVIRANKSFVVRSVAYPDGNSASLQNWILKDETFSFTPSIEGAYTFRLSSANGRSREMTMNVVKCDQ